MKALLEGMYTRLDNMLAYPRMWGTPLAVELQYLQAVEFLHFLEKGYDPDYRIMGAWRQVLNQEGHRANVPLADQSEGFEALQVALPKLRDAVLGR